MRARLAGETDLAGFRAQARGLLAAGMPPEHVHWSTSEHDTNLFADAPAVAPAAADAEGPVAVPAGFVRLCETVVLHRDPQRFDLLYRLLWRLVHEPTLRHDPLDPDLLQARRMAHAVGRDMHKMRAFLRFREVADPEASGAVVHVAWFEPEHRIVQANAPWFVRRFTQMRWAILTPDCCAAWDGTQLAYRAGARRDEAPAADAGEQLWLTYYRSIFNPARLKLAMMQKEMPRKYWRNLPEARLIAPLAAQAPQQSGRMIEQPTTQPLRRIPRRQGPAAVVPIIASDTLAGLYQAIAQCRECPIGALATQAVCGEGPPQPRLMLVGEQPGDQEDLRGRPFVGPAGQLLERTLRDIGVERQEVFLTNAVRHFKFQLRGKRRIHKTPGQAEAAACRHWLDEEIRLVQPRALVALGATAARALLQRPVAVTAERGQWHERADGRRVFVTWHPSALLRLPPGEREAAAAQFTHDLRAARDSVG